MTTSRRRFLLLPIAVLATACSTGASGSASATVATASPPPMASSAPTAPASVGPGASAPASASPTVAASPTAGAPVLTQAWATAELTDVATGATFRIADLAGRTIILETMAIWCSKCLAQQGDAYEALAELDPERVAYVLIDVDPSETAEALEAYRERNGFTGTYAVATTDVARALAAEFGDAVLSPSSTPMILIGSDGTVTLTDFGQKSPTEVVALARAHGA